MKYYKILFAFFALIAVSCTDELDFQEINSEDINTKSQNPTNMGVESIFIDNGVSQNCSRNMLVFQDADHYTQVMDDLEDLVDLHKDAFVAQYDYLDDDDFFQMEQQSGFNEFEPLEDFENSLGFCSLRKMLHNMQNDWLSQQPYQTDLSGSPEEVWFNLDDEYESTLLNEQGEVIIDRNLYKYYDDGIIIIDLTTNDLTDILTELNNGANLNDVASDYRPFVEVIEDVIPAQSSQGECYTRVRAGIFVELNHNTAARVSWRINDNVARYRLRHKIRSYTWTSSGWSRKRMRMHAGFEEGTTITGYTTPDCPLEYFIEEDEKNSKKRRKTRKYVFNLNRSYDVERWRYQDGVHTLATWNWVAGHEFFIPVSDMTFNP